MDRLEWKKNNQDYYYTHKHIHFKSKTQQVKLET